MYLIDKSTELKKEATALIKKFKIVESLKPLGKVVIVGSLRLNLMYRRDIDIFVLSDKVSTSKVLAITKKLIDKDIFKGVAIADYKNFTNPYNYKEIFYIKLFVIHNKKEWKIDIFYMPFKEGYGKYVLKQNKKFEKLLKKNSGLAEIILKIKKSYFNGTKYRKNVFSEVIYTAVLEKKIRTLKNFDLYIKNSENLIRKFGI